MSATVLEESLEGPSAFIAIHIGAGEYPASRESAHRKIIRDACIAGMRLLQQNGAAVDVTQTVIKMLEDCAETNAGIGSNLTDTGMVECDASIMDGSTQHFAAVGAVPRVQNPILLAGRLLENQRVASPLMPPLFVAGEGALRLAQRCGLAVEHSLVTPASLQRYRLHKACSSMGQGCPNDTVGALVVDRHGNSAAGVSSGGTSLKVKGRVGHAAIPGCGVWVDQSTTSRVSCCTSGIGEQLIRADFARSVVRLIRDSEDYSLSLSNFMETFYHANIGSSQRPAAGFICHASQAGFDEFWYGYSTPSFGIGYMSSSNPSPTIMIERLPPNSRFRIGGVSL